MAKFAWKEYRGFGRAEYDHVQKLRKNAETWIKASEEEGQAVAQQQKEAYSKILELYKLAITAHNPSMLSSSDMTKIEGDVGQAMRAFQNDPRNQEVIKHLREGKSVPETVQLILTNAAKESGSERSAVWEKLQRELAKNTNNSNTSKRDSVGSRGKEGEVK